MLLLGAKAKHQGLKYSWEEICFPASVRESKCSESIQKWNGLLYWSVGPSMWIHEKLNCSTAIATLLCELQTSQLCLSVHVVTSPQLNSWAIPSVHGVSICSLKQVWDHSSQIFFPWWAKLSYIVCLFPQAKSTVGDSHHTVAGTCKFLFCKTEQHLEKQKIFIVFCPCNKKPQTCLKTN